MFHSWAKCSIVSCCNNIFLNDQTIGSWNADFKTLHHSACKQHEFQHLLCWDVVVEPISKATAILFVPCEKTVQLSRKLSLLLSSLHVSTHTSSWQWHKDIPPYFYHMLLLCIVATCWLNFELDSTLCSLADLKPFMINNPACMHGGQQCSSSTACTC
mgnify:CR=1 FL=1